MIRHQTKPVTIMDSSRLYVCAFWLFALVITAKADEASVRKFPENFQFGAATASYQIEGAWNVSDKSLSIWDVYVREPGAIRDGTTGDDACKSYEYWRRDIEMLKFLGVGFYRFSISWPRLFPNGFVTHISEDGLRYYDDLINELLANGIEPVVTMFHWDLPQSFQDLGGWANPLAADWFADYARQLYSLFGDRVKTWVTLNEPKEFAIYGYGYEWFAPGIKNMAGIAEYMAVKYLLIAHARAWHIYDKEFREKQKGIVGITIAMNFREGATDSPEDIEAGLYALDFEAGLYSHPIFSTEGDWPQRVIERVNERSMEQGFTRSRLPEFTPEEIELVKGSSDFFGFNHYSTKFYTPYTPGMYKVPSYDDDMGVYGSYLDYPQAVMAHTTKIPYGMRKALNWVRENCNDPIIIITENGFSSLSGLADDERVDYYRQYLWNVLEAIEDGCKVISYTAWSLMDNFEWSSGLSMKFGLFEVDYEDPYRTRTARSSALWYQHTVTSRTLDMNYEPEPQHVSF